MTTTTKIIVALLVLLALALGVFGYYTANKALTDQRAAQQLAANKAGPQTTLPVVVAVKPLPPGAPIASDAVKVMPYPMAPEGALTSVDQAIGQVPQAAIGSGAPVLKSALLSGLSMHVQNGFRAVAIHVDKVIAVGDHLHPGDFVDVFFSLPPAQNYGAATGPAAVPGPAQARMLLSDLRVLAVGEQTVAKTLPVASAPAKSAFGPAAQQPVNPNQAPPTPPTSVVLQVPTAEVAKLVMAEESGKLQLAMRNPKDTDQPDTASFPSALPAIEPSLLPVAQRKQALEVPENKAWAGLTLPGLRGKESPPAPVRFANGVKQPPKPTVEIYRGDQKQTVAY